MSNIKINTHRKGCRTKLCQNESLSVVSNSLWPQGQYSPWNSPGQNTGVGSLSLLQGMFPTQGLNPGLPHCRQILYQLSYQGSPFEDLHVKTWATQEKVILFLRPFILFIVKLWYRKTTEQTFMYVCFYHANLLLIFFKDWNCCQI